MDENNKITRQEHVEWCKKRALDLIDEGDVVGAFLSMASDLGKHIETDGHTGIGLGMMMQINGHLDSPDKMKKFILGFN